MPLAGLYLVLRYSHAVREFPLCVPEGCCTPTVSLTLSDKQTHITSSIYNRTDRSKDISCQSPT